MLCDSLHEGCYLADLAMQTKCFSKVLGRSSISKLRLRLWLYTDPEKPQRLSVNLVHTGRKRIEIVANETSTFNRFV